MSKMAIAYGMKKKAKKLAAGGEVDQDAAPTVDPVGADSLKKAFAGPFTRKAEGGPVACKSCGYAEGGEVKEHDKLNQGKVDMKQSTEHEDDDMVMRIMRKRYSEGGQVANDTGNGEVADESPNQFDDLVLDDTLESSSDGENNGDHLGNKRTDDDEKDIVSRIMKSRNKKDKNPKE